MSVGSLRCIVVNVTDFEVSYRLWSAVMGWEALGPAQGLHGWLGHLGTRNPPKHKMILIPSTRQKAAGRERLLMADCVSRLGDCDRRVSLAVIRSQLRHPWEPSHQQARVQEGRQPT